MSAVRPTDFATFHGQLEVVNNLKIAVASAKHQGKCLGHTLLGGPAGVGKTTLGAHVLPFEMGAKAHLLNCASVDKPADLTLFLCQAGEGDIVFLDEIHALPPAARDHMLTVLEDGYMMVLPGEDIAPMRVTLPKFTVIGATTRRGDLDDPIRSRFAHAFTLTNYSEVELCQIATWHIERRGFKARTEVCLPLAQAAQGVARTVTNLVEAAIDTLVVQRTDEGPRARNITLPIIQDTLQRLGYIGGFNPEQIRYLTAVVGARGLGLKQLERVLGEHASTIEDVLEPWLLRSGLIHIGTQGRTLTEGGVKLYTEVIKRTYSNPVEKKS